MPAVSTRSHGGAFAHAGLDLKARWRQNGRKDSDELGR
jgi:hypothetical protein